MSRGIFHPRGWSWLLAGAVAAALGAADAQSPPPADASPPAKGVPAAFTPPPLEPQDAPFPINLPAALQLAHINAWDIAIANQQLRIAAAQLEGAKVLWLPTLYGGVEWVHHDGPLQNVNGSLTDSSRSSLYAGGAPFAVFAVTDALFQPLAQRQVARAQEANVQTATNDTLTSVAVVYFDAQEARADLASILDVSRRVSDLVAKVESLAPGLVPAVEVARVRVLRANVRQAVEVARQRWRVASAELARVLRLSPTVLVEPLEPPHLQVTLIPPERCPDELIPLAVATRPELTYQEALAQAAQERVRQEKVRPFLPILLVRGAGTQTPYPLAFGAFGGGHGDSLSNFNARSDWDVQALWEVRNLGFGNHALVRENQARYELARAQEYRFRDLVAREVVQAHAELQAAHRRTALAEEELREALLSATQNLEGLGETKRVGGNIVILVIRPQEVVAALQSLSQAYYDYYGSVADYNRAQFRLYRALGNPAQQLYGHDGLCGPPLSQK
jgi:outer membrane protein TolC